MERSEVFCRSATLEDLKLIVKSLNDNGVDYLLIGGYALFAHGYERSTTDIDIIVPNTLESGKKLIAALMVLPDKAASQLKPEWFEDVDSDDYGNIRVADDIVIDIMFNACGETYETLKKHQQTIELEGLSIKTIDLYGILKTKQTVREKDINDRRIIERALEVIEVQHKKDIWHSRQK